ncbi:MAG TPA: hypothetical protein V6C86_24230 [Oculatellaceae cyanobacterium]
MTDDRTANYLAMFEALKVHLEPLLGITFNKPAEKHVLPSFEAETGQSRFALLLTDWLERGVDSVTVSFMMVRNADKLARSFSCPFDSAELAAARFHAYACGVIQFDESWGVPQIPTPAQRTSFLSKVRKQLGKV